MILAAGGEGVLTHLFDAAVLEGLVFYTKFFEDRSIKHASLQGLASRMAKFGKIEWTASLHFGAFDGSLGNVTCSEVETSILTALLDHLIDASRLTTKAMTDRQKEVFKARVMDEARLKVDEKIRESGDRGTSILNFMTNFDASF